ncbi:hypothetical protein TTRE_0000304301 [Trichuris trichiura]|uniref:Uncharacterized protein n=1 Tax=Trichuris trichiura TaxID=36087 RepID=A0A077Z548_TRITR|nr:hypothetical protein TTRE_0000304301 [Trichuris trichiura]
MALYIVRYLDSDNHEKVSLSEYERKIAAAIRLIEERRKSRVSGRQRDPSVGWILDFNGDRFVDYNELTAAKEIFHGGFNASKSGKFLKEEL